MYIVLDKCFATVLCYYIALLYQLILKIIVQNA